MRWKISESGGSKDPPARRRTSTPAGAAPRGSRALRAVLEAQRAAVRLGDLAAERQTDARAGRLGREERHEQVRRVRQPGSFILDGELQEAVDRLPVDPHLAARLERRIDGVADDVDQQLFELIRIGFDLRRLRRPAPRSAAGSRARRSAWRAAGSGSRRCCGLGSCASCA